MLNKTARTTIIIIMRWFLPILLLVFLVPQLLQLTHSLHQLHNFFTAHKIRFLIAHGIFYLVLFCLWPTLIYTSIKRGRLDVTKEQINTALNAKWYLLLAMVFIELLVWYI